MSGCNVKKLNRKLKKFQHVVYSQTGITCSMNPTKNIAICNAGLVNGLSEETIVDNFLKYGSIEDIAVLPGRSCCFLSYLNKDMAQHAFDECNGKLNIAQDNKPIYLLFAESLPERTHQSTIWDEHPPGLIILKDFITQQEEDMLLGLCNFEADSNGQMKNRQVKHFGYEFRYDNNNIDKDKPLSERIPSECNFLWPRLDGTKWNQFNPDQLTVNYYSPGQGIPAHVDTHSAFEDPIMSLSLGSAVVMEFKKDDKHICICLPQRSLCIMSGECRYVWTHGITPRKYDYVQNTRTLIERGTRVSFTFRKIRQGECNCEYTAKCDKQKFGEVDASKLEKLHVIDVYDNIASHFNETRNKPWPNVLEFVMSFQLGSILVDIGCGNGKYLGKNKSIFDVGCDTSTALISVCKRNGFETFLTNCLNLPMKDDAADGAISIAVIHHLANEERRLQAVKEMVRILRHNGKALIYVWAMDQHKDNEKTSYIKQDRRNRKSKGEVVIADNDEVISVTEGMKLPVHVNRTQFKRKDVLVPWRLKSHHKIGSTFFRYYHVFEEGELENMCSTLPDVEVERSYYDQGNWCVVLRKRSIKSS